MLTKFAPAPAATYQMPAAKSPKGVYATLEERELAEALKLPARRSKVIKNNKTPGKTDKPETSKRQKAATRKKPPAAKAKQPKAENQDDIFGMIADAVIKVFFFLFSRVIFLLL